MDIHNAFLHGILDEEVYMKIPQGYLEHSHDPNLVCKLYKSIYGLKQASRTWFTKLRDVISLLGFQQCKSDYSIFVKHANNSMTIILAYIDDLLITGDNIDTITKIKAQLKQHFFIKDLGALKYFLGLEFSYDNDNTIFMSQRKFSLDLLDFSKLTDCKPSTTPATKVRTVVSTDSSILLQATGAQQDKLDKPTPF